MKHALAFFAILAAALLAAAPAPAQTTDAAVPQSMQQLQMSFAPLVKKTGPAVVNIYTKRIVKEQMQLISPFFNDPFFGQFFGGRMAAPGATRQRVENSLGSGVIVDPSGIIATNSHVIKDATEIVVVTADGREYTAEKKLVDEQTDLAILHIDTKGQALPSLQMADSDALQVGDIVLAIGNPFGLGQTVTSGIISGLARTGVGPSDYGFFIQTDAAINPGNSGGALVDINGRLVGINSMIFSRSGGYMGIGFAIPANLLRTVVEASKTGGKIVRPWTGFSGQTVTSDMADSLGLDRASGVLVNRVLPGGPAEKAGLKVGDVITAANGIEVRDPSALHYRLATVAMGTPTELTLTRAGKQIKTSITAQTAPEIPPRQATVITDKNPLQGATIANLSPAVAQELGGIDQESGVVIMQAGEGLAARVGLQDKDVIASINGRAVQNVGEVQAQLKAAKAGWSIGLLRGNQSFTVQVR